jgi:hypothetical protein
VTADDALARAIDDVDARAGDAARDALNLLRAGQKRLLDAQSDSERRNALTILFLGMKLLDGAAFDDDARARLRDCVGAMDDS